MTLIAYKDGTMAAPGQNSDSKSIDPAKLLATLIQNQMPKIYDVSIDEFRPVTQADINSLSRVTEAFGLWRELQAKLSGLCTGQNYFNLYHFTRCARPKY